jgi:hypothetical protein
MDAIREIIVQQRKTAMQYNGQMTLGRLIKATESIDKLTASGEEKTVHFDFACFFPCGISSWRGAYDELALEYCSSGNAITISEFIQLLKGAVGKTFLGWKGGEYVMTEDTPIWVSNPGEACDTAVLGVKDIGWRIVIETGYREY